MTEINEYPGRRFEGIWENGRPAELAFFEREPGVQLGDVYLAKVKDVVKGLKAAFVQLSPSQTAFLNLEDAPEGIRVGDELIVQVQKEAQKTKDPVVSTHLSLTGRLAVLVTDRGAGEVHLSARIHDDEWRAAAKEKLLPLLGSCALSAGEGGVLRKIPEYGFIVRTNAYGEDLDAVYEEAFQLLYQYHDLMKRSFTRPCFTRLRLSEPPWLTRLYKVNTSLEKAQDGAAVAEIVTDLPDVYERVVDFLAAHDMAPCITVRMYTDKYALSRLYGVSSALEEALGKRVWLKSGGYLIIEPTEAMNVIDVNTGKSQGNRRKEESILSLNREAAEECARQIRLRNLSGMILIDFIDMDEEEHKKELLRYMEEVVASDPVPVAVVDMTKLGIIECTRKKIARPLHEQCHGYRHLNYSSV